MRQRKPRLLTDNERRAIASLRRLAKRWPQSLMLFSASGTLCVMPNNGEDGFRETSRDSEQVIETIHGIPNDGGDW
jgi:hypothetical protein